MKKRSPTKNETDISFPNDYKNQHFYKSDAFSKIERAGRLQMLIKNHGKIIYINQIAVNAIKCER